MIRPGDLYYANIPEAGRRPVLVVSRESLNRGHYVCVVLLTSSRVDLRRTLPNCVYFPAMAFGLSASSVAQCETMTALDIEFLDLAAGVIGRLDEDAMRQVVRAIGHVIQAECELF